MSTEPFKREYGFIYLVTPEDKAKYGPKLATDEYWYGDRWGRVAYDDGDFYHPQPYRRPISPGPNFEIVPLDGVIKEGDWYTYNGSKWHECGNTCWGHCVTVYPVAAIRRPIKPVEQGGWVSVKERYPEPHKPFWYLPSHSKVPGFVPQGLQHDWFELRPFVTHWRYCDGNYQIPPAPQPPRPAAEVAFDAAWPTIMKRTSLAKDSAYCLFKQGWDEAKSNKGEL